MSDLPAPLTSPRAERLRALCAQLDELPEDSTDDDVNRLVDEVHLVSDEILASPTAGVSGLAEQAMAVHYWFRLRGTANSDGDPACEAVRALVKSALNLAAGGAHV